jgi:uncharacterized protein (TIGR03089 family)
METVSTLFAAAVATDPTRPLLTYYDDATGERTELSGATLANWAAKTANLLVDGLGLGVDDRALVRLPVHWQTAAVLLGAWSAGLSVTGEEPAEVAFVAPAATEGVTVSDRYVVGLHPFGLPLRDVPAGYADFVADVRGYGDRFVPAGPTPDQAELCQRAAARAAALGIGAGARVLIDADRHPDPVDWLLAPLAARATAVVVAHSDPAKLADRATTERAVPVG